MIFDCCCSASMGMLNHRLDGTGKSWVNGDFATKRQIKANVLCLAACNDKETAKSTVFLRKILSAEGYLDESGNGLSTGRATPKNLVQLRKEVTTKMAGQDMNMQIEVSHRFNPTKSSLGDFLNGRYSRSEPLCEKLSTGEEEYPLGLALKKGKKSHLRFFKVKRTKCGTFFLAYYAKEDEKESNGNVLETFKTEAQQWTKKPSSAKIILLSGKQFTVTTRRAQKTLKCRCFVIDKGDYKNYELTFKTVEGKDTWIRHFRNVLTKYDGFCKFELVYS